ncbi:MAG: hypothetical protein K6T61_02485 [Bryobacteraceae bacterium]|nr:hypothetical protein [Bryobacteraceae bacterium]
MAAKASSPCAICETRRPRRFCPALRSEICAPCCGTSREVTLYCPLDCPHLQEAHRHERPPEPDPEQLPHPDIEITERFLERNSALIHFLSQALLRHTEAAPTVVDQDVREALDAMIRTYRTLQSGLYYESRPSNLYAAELQRRLREDLKQYLQQQRERAGLTVVRDADVLGALVFLRRVEFASNNGRPRSRAFLGLLRERLAPPSASGADSSPTLYLPRRSVE